jgi:hypothetical protein
VAWEDDLYEEHLRDAPRRAYPITRIRPRKEIRDEVWADSERATRNGALRREMDRQIATRDDIEE